MRNKARNLLQPAGFSLMEIVIAISIIGIMSAVAVPMIASYIDGAKRTRAENDIQTMHSGFFKMYNDTNIPPGWRSCPNTGGNGTTDSPRDWLSSVTGVVTDSGGAGLQTNVEDMDNHMLYQCSNSESINGTAYNTAGGSWLGPYVDEADKLDPWGKPYILMIEDYTPSDPGWILSAGGSDAILSTAKDANTVGETDVGIKLIFRQ